MSDTSHMPEPTSDAQVAAESGSMELGGGLGPVLEKNGFPRSTSCVVLRFWDCFR